MRKKMKLTTPKKYAKGTKYGKVNATSGAEGASTKGRRVGKGAVTVSPLPKRTKRGFTI